MPIDWSKAAWLTAQGAKPGDIVAAVGCSRSQLRRRQQQCPLFCALVAQYSLTLAEVGASQGRSLQPPSPGEPRLPLAETVRARLEQEILDGNLKVAMWLAERLRLFSPDDKEGTDGTLRRLLQTMTEAERTAFSRRD